MGEEENAVTFSRVEENEDVEGGKKKRVEQSKFKEPEQETLSNRTGY